MIPAWRLRAACAGTDPELFFRNAPGAVEHAKRICAGCPVMLQCAQAGAAEAAGIWGGMTAEERGVRTLTAYRRGRKAAAAVA